MIVQDIIPLWKNDGTANITCSNGGSYWFWPYHGVTVPSDATATAASPNNGFSNSDFDVETNFWFDIPVRGADYMVIQYTSKLEAVGTITAITSDFLALGLQGKFYSPTQHPSLHLPQVVRAQATPIGNTGQPEWSPWELKVQRISWTRENDSGFATRFTNVTAAGGTEHHNGAVFLMGNTGGSNATGAPLGIPVPAANPPASRTPTTSDYPGWALFVHQKNHNVPVGAATYGYPSIGGIKTAWVCMNHVPSFTGAGPIRIQGEMHAILLRETGRT